MTSEAQAAANLRQTCARIGCTVEEYQARRANGEKRCQLCKAWHPMSEFSPAPSQWDGLAPSCRTARNADRTARKQAARERAAVEAEARVLSAMADGWWPPPPDPDDDGWRGRQWPEWTRATVIGQLWLFGEKACVGLDPELFFDEDRVVEAKRVCRACPSADLCLTAALQRDERAGVWGQMTTDERDELMGRRSPAWAS